MRLHTLKAPEGSNRKPIRKGRGTATGRGKTAGRGQDGQKSRSGGGVRLGFEGGQMPLTRRVPKRGFTNDRFKKEVAAINIEKLNSLKAGTVVTLEELKDAKVDMFSTVFIGNSQTVKIGNRMVTRRGYSHE